MLIGLTGAPGCGKDTLAYEITKIGLYRQYRFADPIKAMLTELGIPLSVWEDHDLKEKELPWLGKSPRYLAQTLGTEWARNLVHTELWALLAKQNWEAEPTNMVISDVRFPNESQWIKDAGGMIIQIIRDADHQIDNKGHASEAGIPAEHIDARICNVGTPEELYLLATHAIYKYKRKNNL